MGRGTVLRVSRNSDQGPLRNVEFIVLSNMIFKVSCNFSTSIFSYTCIREIKEEMWKSLGREFLGSQFKLEHDNEPKQT